MQKDDSDILDDWIVYHSYLFGKENIYIIDNGSTDCSLDIIKKHEVNYRVFDGDFCHKSKELSSWMSEEKCNCDFVVPLDVDEFIVLNKDGFSSVKESILKEFDSLKKYETKFKFKQYECIPNLLEVHYPIDELTYFFETNLSTRGIRRRKTFFPSSVFVGTDQGNHVGKISSGSNEYMLTDLCLLHYKVRGFSHFRKKYLRWEESYGQCNPEMGLQWKKICDEIKKGDDEAQQKFFDLMHKSHSRPVLNISCLKNKISDLRYEDLRKNHAS